jgi:hypothetical protein
MMLAVSCPDPNCTSPDWVDVGMLVVLVVAIVLGVWWWWRTRSR